LSGPDGFIRPTDGGAIANKAAHPARGIWKEMNRDFNDS